MGVGGQRRQNGRVRRFEASGQRGEGGGHGRLQRAGALHDAGGEGFRERATGSGETRQRSAAGVGVRQPVVHLALQRAVQRGAERRAALLDALCERLRDGTAGQVRRLSAGLQPHPGIDIFRAMPLPPFAHIEPSAVQGPKHQFCIDPLVARLHGVDTGALHLSGVRHRRQPPLHGAGGCRDLRQPAGKPLVGLLGRERGEPAAALLPERIPHAVHPGGVAQAALHAVLPQPRHGRREVHGAGRGLDLRQAELLHPCVHLFKDRVERLAAFAAGRSGGVKRAQRGEQHFAGDAVLPRQRRGGRDRFRQQRQRRDVVERLGPRHLVGEARHLGFGVSRRVRQQSVHRAQHPRRVVHGALGSSPKAG